MAAPRVDIPQVDIPHDELETFCVRWGVAKLELFGSALRNDFGPDSDVDLLVTFGPDSDVTLLDMAEMEDELSRLFGRSAQLVSRQAIERARSSPRKKNILDTATPIVTRRLQ